MENYGVVLNKRLRMLGVLLLLIVAAFVFTSDIITDSFNVSRELAFANDFIHGFKLGIFMAVEVGIVYEVFKLRKALSDETSLEEMYILEHDERKVFIQ